MTQTRELYRSAPNGDRWSLVRDTASERVVIEHEPNASSGGQAPAVDQTGQAHAAAARARAARLPNHLIFRVFAGRARTAHARALRQVYRGMPVYRR